MTSAAGVWIDHEKAVITFLAGKNLEKKQVDSGAAPGGSATDRQDPRSSGHREKYYDEVIAHIREADSILILGPGEAKIELEERLGNEALRGRIVGVETVDTMTHRQVASRVRQRFLKNLTPWAMLLPLFFAAVSGAGFLF